MEAQELFDKAYLGVIKQGKPAVNKNGNCLYYVSKNLHCGVGHCLTEEAQKAFDRQHDSSINGILTKNKSKYIEPWMHEHKNLLIDIQTAHDNAYGTNYHDALSFIGVFKKNMKKLAKLYELKVPESVDSTDTK
jgi:hypothetical protein